ncbi:MAG TPA: methyltransferase domain-containing protein [Solirubrobacterales bacterium]|nr:methyltransferase domain-containing protein [Solirubrobacterales bacterium]
MRSPLPTASDLDTTALAAVAAGLEAGDVKGCCATVYEQPAVRWLLGGELHPGGEELTRRTLELARVAATDRLLDVASGAGTTAMLAARERACEVVGLDYGAGAVAGARAEAEASGHGDRVRFVEGDAEALPFEDDSFDVVVCECALCTFPDKTTAVAEMRRVLRPGGRLALSDVTADHDRLPEDLRGTMATVACVGAALPEAGYRELLEAAGFEIEEVERATADVERLCERVRTRLRGAKVLGFEGLVPIDGGLAHAIDLAAEAKRAVGEGALGYAVMVARLRG